MSDQIQRFLFDQTNVRGEIAHLESAYQEVIARHGCPIAVNRLLGELLAAVALLTDTVKLDGTLSIEVRGPGVLKLLMAESNPGGELRGIARLAEQAERPAEDAGLRDLVTEGQIIITLDPKEGNRYQGIVAMDHATLGECLGAYFAQSEQLPTRMWLSADQQQASGLLLQRLPHEAQGQDIDAWDRIQMLADTVTRDELLTLTSETLLHRLFHQEPLQAFAPSPLHFGCTCSRERLARGLLTLNADELRDIVAEQGGINTHCHFCNSEYHYTESDIEMLIENADAVLSRRH